MKSLRLSPFTGMALLAVSCAAAGQPESGSSGDTSRAMSLEEIVVTARRREESVQNVPQTVNVVTADQMERLNVRTLTDIQALVPGLTLSGGNSFSTQATVRGVAFNPEASGNNPTVEFYLNDAPISSNFLFQSMFDVGQFELLRGPQGTLRGRASPSGSITLTARRPELGEFGAVVNGTATDRNAYKGDAAVNVPIVSDILAVRIAAVYDENEGNEVDSIQHSLNSRVSEDPYRETKAARGSVRFTPTDWVDLNLMYQRLEQENIQYAQVESESRVTGVAPSGRIIDAFDRLAIEDTGNHGAQDQDIFTLNADFRFAGQKISYVGAYNKQDFVSMGSQDDPDFFGAPRFELAERTFRDPAGAEAVCAEQGRRTGTVASTYTYFQCSHGIGKRDSHELRLASEERVFGMFDYLVGALYDHNENKNRLTQETPILAAASPPRIGLVNLTPVMTDGETTEKSIFANVTAHIGDRFEISGGSRYIEYRNFRSFQTGTSKPIPDERDNQYATIYTGSLKYSFTDDLMVYGSVGTSWRPGAFALGDFSLRSTPRERSFFDLPHEESTSYEIGLRTTFLDGRARANLTVFKQDFDNYVYRGQPVYYINYAQQGAVIAPAVSTFNFVAAVPVKVEGVEAEASFQVLPNWNIGANFAYADGKIENGLIACTDLNADGTPDQNAALPTLAALQAAVGPGENISQCQFSGPSTFTPKWSATLHTEAYFHLAQWSDVFVRGLLTYYTDTERDPTNALDDVSAYSIFNLYTGLRDPDGTWEVSLFAKNLFETERVLSRGSAPVSRQYRTFTSSVNFSAPYYAITTTSPREFGVNFRWAFGSR